MPTTKQSIQSPMSDADKADEGVAQPLFRRHVTLYFASHESERVVIHRDIERAEQLGHDIEAGASPVGEWRSRWPIAARRALLALWATPRRP
jgi:hypothetical protein